MEADDFDSVSWQNEPSSTSSRPDTASSATSPSHNRTRDTSKRSLSHDPVLDSGADAVDMAGIGEHGKLECTVGSPMKENDGTKDAYVSYSVTTDSDFASFQKSSFSVRRRFTDFVFLYKTLCKQFPAHAIPPLPDKHKMEYVRGDRFGPDFTQRRAHSLHRFIRRLTLHPFLRRQLPLITFLESSDWNAHMRSHRSRSTSVSESSTSVFDNFTDTFVNAFSKVHKPDKRFIDVREKADKLDEDLSHVEKIIARVARREADLETDYLDLSTQFMKLAVLEPGVEGPVHSFAQSVEATAKGITGLKEHTERDYLGSLRDMEAYIVALKQLLKSREQKQIDFEELTEYLTKASYDRDTLASASHNSGLSGPGGFIRSKIEDVRGVDHEQSRRERVRKLELHTMRLQGEVEQSKKDTEMLDEQVVREVSEFERIKGVEFKDTLGTLAGKHVEFYEGVVETWERYLREVEGEGGGGHS